MKIISLSIELKGVKRLKRMLSRNDLVTLELLLVLILALK